MIKTRASAFGPGCVPVSSIAKTPLFRMTISALLAFAALSARAAEYNWTGLGDGHSWSDANNWTNAAGTAGAPTPANNAKHSYWFPVDDSGLVVTQDVSGAMIISDLSFGFTGSGPTTVEFASKQLDCVLTFGANSTVDVPEGMTLLWKTDGNRWNNSDISKNGAGRMVFDMIRSPQTQRGLVVNAGTVEVAATSANTKFLVKMGGSDINNLPVFINRKDGQILGGFDTLRNGGRIQLNGMTVTNGAPGQMTGGVNTLPLIEADGGTLFFQNERMARLSEMNSQFGVALDRADVIVPDFGGAAINWKFDDASDPTKDDVGSGSRMIVSGTPAVVTDETRGRVLSFTGGAYFKGPDENIWLDGFNPSDGMTVAFWLKPDASCNAQAKILFWGQNVAGKAFAMRMNNANIMATTWRANQFITQTNLKDGNWHHLAVTCNGASSGQNMTLYYDGVAIHMWNDTPFTPVAKDLYIGNMAGTAWGSTGSGTPYTGLMDDFLLASRCFSAQEIHSLYANGAISDADQPTIGDFSAQSSGALSVESESVAMKTLSGIALAGGVELKKDGSTLTVGTGAGATATGFKGVIGGGNTTLVKTGADYSLALAGAASAVTNVVVDSGTLTLRRPRASAGLVAYYSFDDIDEPGFDTTSGGMTLSKYGTGTGAFSAVDGIRGKALHFPGGISLNANGGKKPANFPGGNDSYTVSVWIKPTADACTGTVPIFSWGDGSTGLLSMLRFNGADKLMFANYTYDNGVSGLTLSDGEWHHVVITYDGTTRTKSLYYDNVKKLSIAISADLNVGKVKNSFEIGHTAVIGSRVNQYYSGDMDELMVFNYAWSADEVAAEYNRTAVLAPATAPALPTPVARWTFDGENPLAEEGGNAALALVEGTGTNGCTTVTFESGENICGKAARFSATSGFLKLAEFPTGIIPSGNNTFTIIVRYRPDTMQPSGYNPCVVGWGDDNGWSAGTLFRIGLNAGQGSSVRCHMRSVTIENEDTYRTTLGNDRLRWYTVALVYHAPGMGAYGGTARLFINGEYRKTQNSSSGMATEAANFAIGSNAAGSMYMFGLVDDVQIYNCTLTDGEVRRIAEQFEASKGQTTTGTAVATGVLTAQPDVTVAQGATLKVASVESIGNLSGAGAVEIASLARLNITGATGFEGTVSGEGIVGIADGATLDFGDGSQPLMELDCPIALGANVTVNTTAKQGRLLIAQATSFTGAENLASWTATVGDRKYSFVVSSDGKKLYLSIQSGTVLILM